MCLYIVCVCACVQAMCEGDVCEHSELPCVQAMCVNIVILFCHRTCNIDPQTPQSDAYRTQPQFNQASRISPRPLPCP